MPFGVPFAVLLGGALFVIGLYIDQLNAVFDQPTLRQALATCIDLTWLPKPWPLNLDPLFEGSDALPEYAVCAQRPSTWLTALLARYEINVPIADYPAGTIYTSDPTMPTAECFLVSDGAFAAVGSADRIRNLWRENRPNEDLKTFYTPRGAIITPGLTDAHAHTLQWGFKEQLPLAGSRSIKEIIQKIEAYVRSHPEVEADRSRWIRGLGWDQTRFEEGRWPTAADLESSPLLAGRRIALVRVDVHATWVSQAVLDMLPNPLPLSDEEIEKNGGKVMRGPDGALSGVFVDTAEALLPLPPPSPEEKRAWFELAARDALSVGLVGIHDAFADAADVGFYKGLADEGKLPLRMYLMGTLPSEPIPTSLTSPTNTSSPSEWPHLPRLHGYGPQSHLTLRGIKLFADGALGSFGAALLEPYSDDSTTSGLMRTNPEVLRSQIEALAERGWQVNTHAIGDRANQVVLDVYEDVLTKKGMRAEEWRPRIEHAQIMTPADLERIGRLGVIPSVQPTHATSDMGYAESRLGPDRIKGAYAYKTLLSNSRRSIMPLGSDFPVEGINPLLGFYAAVSRLDTEGNSPHGIGGWYPEQKLSRAEALAGMTTSAAYASFAEDVHGAIRVGLKADWVMWDRDIMQVPVEEILQAKVRATVVDGEIEYGEMYLCGMWAIGCRGY
ncbi:unnamed protein product [Peniophora sp. CBMAI 1063]|nr:unnamed protein product [Peniophora sp. CBMAI 1063]